MNKIGILLALCRFKCNIRLIWLLGFVRVFNQSGRNDINIKPINLMEFSKAVSIKWNNLNNINFLQQFVSI